MLGVIRVVKFVVLAEIHFPNKPTFSQKRQGAINRGARNRGVPFPSPAQQLFGGKMLFSTKNRIDDHLPLGSDPQMLAFQESHEFLFRRCFAHRWHKEIIFSKLESFKIQVSASLLS